MVFVIDSSGSIRDANKPGAPDNWLLILQFMASIVRILDVSPYGTRVGVVMYSKVAENMFFMKTYQYKDDVINAILRLERNYMGGTTNTSGGLRTMHYEQFTTFNGDRSNVKNMAIVITDGESNEDEYRTISDAESARADGISIFSIGVTDAVNAREVKEISSMPQVRDDNYWLSADFNVLERIASAVASQSCAVTPGTPAPPTVPGLLYGFCMPCVVTETAFTTYHTCSVSLPPFCGLFRDTLIHITTFVGKPPQNYDTIFPN